MKYFAIFLLLLIFCFSITLSAIAEDKKYVGSKACKECHEDEYATYYKFAKKSSSFESILAMKPKLTSEEFESCFECHTTGYGKKSGFISEEKTPELKNAGCEVCHGPGSLHIELDGDPDEINHELAIEDCTTCHNEDRVSAFNFKPLLFGGAH